jgi:hypothetical protein
MAVTTPNALPMVLLPAGPSGETCLDLVKLWASHGMLRRSLWIRSEDVVEAEHSIPDATGWLVEGDAVSAVSVDRAHAMTKLGRRSLVVLSTPGMDSQSSSELTNSAGLLVDLLDSVSPENVDHAEAAAPSHYFHVIAAPTGMSQIDSSRLLAIGFTANLIVSPEDRRAADQSAVIVRGGRQQAAWAVAHAATVAGIWTGLRDDFWTGLQHSGALSSSVLAHEVVLPVRSFVRLVSSSVAARRALESAMVEVADGSVNSLAWPAARHATDPSGIIRDCLAAMDSFDGGRISYTSPQPTPAPGKKETASKIAVGEFLRFSRREIAGVPSYYKQRWKTRMSKRMTKHLSGEEGHEIVTVDGLGPDELRLQEQFERQAIEAERVLSHLEAELPTAAPNLWQAVRKTTLGLLDGNTLPDPVPTPAAGGQPLVLARPILSVPPPEPWQPSREALIAMPGAASVTELTVPSCSPRDAARVQELINAAQVEIRGEVAGLRAAVAEVSVDEDDLEDIDETVDEDVEDAFDDLIDIDDIDETVDEDDDADADAEDKSNQDDENVGDADEDFGDEDDEDDYSDLAAADSGSPSQERRHRDFPSAEEVRLEKAQQRLSTVESASIELNRWVSERSPGLIWGLASVIDNRAKQATRDMESFREQATNAPAVDWGEPRRARNRFVNLFMTVNIFAIILGLLLWQFGPDLENALNGAVPQWVFWVVFVILFVFVHVQVLLSYYRRRSKFIRTMRILLHNQKEAMECAKQSAYAVARLDGVYEQLMDWGELLGFVVHQPWLVDDAVEETNFNELAESLPACLDVAVPDPEDVKGSTYLRQTAEAAIAGRGWRGRVFENMLDLYLAEESPDLEGVDPRVLDFDSPAAPNGSRRGLLHRMRNGQVQRQMANKVVQEQSEHLYEGTGNLRSHSVKPLHEVAHGSGAGSMLESEGESHSTPPWGTYLDAVCMGQTEFTRKLWSDVGLMDQASRARIDSLVWLRGDIPDLAPDGLGQLEVAPPTENRGVEVVSRIDVGGPVEPRLLRLFDEGVNPEDFQPPAASEVGPIASNKDEGRFT